MHILTNLQEAKTLAKKIINRGKEAFSKKCYLDALWKYDNAYQLCCVKCLSSNLKGKALLGCATASFELLKESPPHERHLLGLYSVSCSSECIDSAHPKFQSEVSRTQFFFALFFYCVVITLAYTITGQQ